MPTMLFSPGYQAGRLSQFMYMPLIRYVWLGICFLAVVQSQAQTFTVVNEKDGLPAVAAHLTFTQVSDGKSLTVLTDATGKATQPTTMQIYPVALQINYLGSKPFFDTLQEPGDGAYALLPADISINEVVITGQYEPDVAANTVHTIKVINRKKIDMMAAQNLRDVLSNELNIRLGQDNVLGSSMTLQGISGQNIKILIDGVPVIGRLNGEIDLSQINMNNVERIEIVEGPLSVNFGTDALAGTVNLIMKKGQRRTWSAGAGAFYESNGQYNVSANTGFQKKGNMVQLSGGRNYFDGWTEGDAPFTYKKEMLADSQRVQSWNPKEQVFGRVLLGTTIKDFQVNLTGDAFREHILNRGMPSYSQTANDDVYLTNRMSTALNVQGKIGRYFGTKLLVGYNHYQRRKNTYVKDLTSLEETLRSDEDVQDTTVFRTWMSRGTLTHVRPESRLHYEIGYDLNLEGSTARRMKNQDQQIGDYALFATAEYTPVSNLTFRPGLRVTYNTRYKAPLIPSLNIRYLIPMNTSVDASSITLRASYARGFRAPTLKDLYFDFVDFNHNITGNEDLEAEYSHNFILNGVWQKISNQKIFKIELNNFYNSISNRIQLVATETNATTYTYRNIGTFTTFGSTLSGDMAVRHLKLSIGVGYNALYNGLSEYVSTVSRFSYSPELRSSVLYEFKKPGVSLGLLYKYTGRSVDFVLNQDDEVVQSTLADYHILDFSVTKTFAKGRYAIGAGTKNLLDVTNISRTGISGGVHSSGASYQPLSMGRTYFLKLDVNLNFN